MSAIRFVVDRQARSLVDFNGSPTAIGALFQGNQLQLQIQFVDPTGNPVVTPYAIVGDLGSNGLRVSIGQTPTGTSGGPTPLALQTTWTWDATNKWFTGTLALNTSGIDTYIGTSSEKVAFFEINLLDGSDRQTYLQEQFTLKAVVDEATTTAPTPTDTYMTSAESLATFQKKVGAAGEVLVLTSANGLYAVEFGCNDDGTIRMNQITL